MPFTKADWVNTSITLVCSGIAAFVGERTIAFLIICLGIVIFLCVHILERKDTETKVLYILGCIVFVPVLYFSVIEHSLFYKPPQSTEPTASGNIKSRILDWVRAGGHSASPNADNKEEIDVVIYGSKLNIYRISDGVLRVQCALYLTSEQQDTLAKLKPDKQKQLDHEINVQVLQFGLQNFSFAQYPKFLAVYKEIPIPITESMTQESFMRAVEQVQRAGFLMQDILDKDFQEIKTHK